MEFNFLNDEINILYDKMRYLAKKSISKNSLEKLWQKTEGLSPLQLFKAILTSTSINTIRRNIRKETGTLVTPEETVVAFRKMLNENALNILNDMDFSYLERKRKTRIKREELIQGTNNASLDSNSGTANS